MRMAVARLGYRSRIPSFALLDHGEVVVLGPRGEYVDLLPRRLAGPLVDPSAADRAPRAHRSRKKSLDIERADARIRTADPFITRQRRVRYGRPREGMKFLESG